MINVELLKEKLNDAMFEIEDLKNEVIIQKSEIEDLTQALKKDEEIINRYEDKIKNIARTHCWICGHPMIWSNDFSYEDFGIYEPDGPQLPRNAL